MIKALDKFCALSDENKEEFMKCPFVSPEAENFFSLAKAIECKGEDDIYEYLPGCGDSDFVCIGNMGCRVIKRGVQN